MRYGRMDIGASHIQALASRKRRIIVLVLWQKYVAVPPLMSMTLANTHKLDLVRLFYGKEGVRWSRIALSRIALNISDPP